MKSSSFNLSWPFMVYMINKFPLFPVMYMCPGIILSMLPANEGRRYIVTSSLIGCAHSQNDPCVSQIYLFLMTTGMDEKT